MVILFAVVTGLPLAALVVSGIIISFLALRFVAINFMRRVADDDPDDCDSGGYDFPPKKYTPSESEARQFLKERCEEMGEL